MAALAEAGGESAWTALDVSSVLKSPVLLATSGAVLTLGGLVGLLRAYFKYARRLKAIKGARKIRSMADVVSAVSGSNLLQAHLTGIYVKMEGHVVCPSPIKAPISTVLSAMTTTVYHVKPRGEPVHQHVVWSCALEDGAVRVDPTGASYDLENVSRGKGVSEYVLRAGSTVFVLGLLFQEKDGFVIRKGPVNWYHISYRRESDVQARLQRSWTAWQVGAGSTLVAGLLLMGSAYLPVQPAAALWDR